MDKMTWYTTVRETAKIALLQRGMVLGTLGGIILLFSGTMISPPTLEIWGLPLFLVAIGLIAAGLIPYRRLQQRETTPQKLTIDATFLKLENQGETLIALPLSAIRSLHYRDHPTNYGIAIETAKKTVFLPYFSATTFRELQAIIE